MNASNEKKKRERFYLEKFLSVLDKVAEDIKETESPDFIVKLQGKKIGVEVTEFHSNAKGEKGRPRRAIEEAWSVLQETIMEQVGKHGKLQESNGLLFFDKLELPEKSEYKEFTDELIRLSVEMIDSGLRETTPGKEYPLLNRYLKKLFLEKAGVYILWGWNHDVASVGLSESELLKAINPKLRADYKDHKIDELWLLIISGYRLSQAMGIILFYKLSNYNELNRLLRLSKYSKVYIYQYMLNSIYEWPGWVKIA